MSDYKTLRTNLFAVHCNLPKCLFLSRVVRDRGIYGIVSVLWQVYQVFSNGSHHALSSGDFGQTSGALVFENLERAKNLSLDVLADDTAEYGEQFKVVLESVTGRYSPNE